MNRDEIIKEFLSQAGKKGGSAKTERKAEASRKNGKKGGRPKSKTYYSVVYSTWGSDRKHTAWFDNKEEAEEFASHDYRDNPVAHRVSRLEKIREYDQLVAMTKYDFNSR